VRLGGTGRCKQPHDGQVSGRGGRGGHGIAAQPEINIGCTLLSGSIRHPHPLRSSLTLHHPSTHHPHPPTRRHFGGTSEDDVAVPPLFRTALVWGLFMGVSSNLRYQVVFGLERLVDMTIARKVPQVSTVPPGLGWERGARASGLALGGSSSFFKPPLEPTHPNSRHPTTLRLHMAPLSASAL